MRLITIAIIFLTAFAGVLQAQVAAPRINPAANVTLSVFNPAVLPWGGPSRIGLGLLDLEIESQPAIGTPQSAASGDGSTAQVRLVGSNAAFHAEFVSFSLDVEAAFGGGKLDADATYWGVGYQWGEAFSIGLGVESSKITLQTTTEELSLPVFGATLRIQEMILVGAALGTETVGDGTNELERSVFMAGAAWYSRDKMGGIHLEVYVQNTDSGADATTGQNADEESIVGYTAEVIFADYFLVGFQLIDRKVTDPTDPTGAGDTDNQETIFTAGWVDSQGLSFVLTASSDEETDAAQDVTENSALTVSVAYAF